MQVRARSTASRDPFTETANPDPRDLSAPFRTLSFLHLFVLPATVLFFFFLCPSVPFHSRLRTDISMAFGGSGGSLETTCFPSWASFAIGAQKQREFWSRTVSAVAWGRLPCGPVGPSFWRAPSHRPVRRRHWLHVLFQPVKWLSFLVPPFFTTVILALSFLFSPLTS